MIMYFSENENNMDIEKKVQDKDLYAGTHIVLTSDKIGTTEICRQQHKVPFYKTNMLKEHFLLFAVEGTNELQIGKQFISLKKGEMLLIKKATYVEIVKRGESKDDFMYESVSFSLKKDVIIDFIKLVEMDDSSNPTISDDEILIHTYGTRLQTFLASLKPYFDDTEKIKTGLYKLKILELLYDLSEENPVFLQQLVNLNRNSTRDLMHVVELNYLKPYTLEELAYTSGRSLSGFRREFEAVYQTTPANGSRRNGYKRRKS
jgi:hypothetical protein